MGRTGRFAPDNVETLYLQGDDAREFEQNGYCESCLRSAREWAKPDHLGNYEVHGDFDRDGNLVGFLCPDCAEADKAPPGCECPYCGEDRIDSILAPDDDKFCFCLRCRRYYCVGD
jgi:hypothetical protein